MKTCCRARRSWIPPQPFDLIPRRWRSHDRASLTEEALLDKIEAGLGDAPDKPRVDPVTKHVRTAAGELPISPLFDPKWIASRRRKTKVYNPKPSGRFRSKVYNNTYARALETPIRGCPASRSVLPRFFLQDFEVVEHPKTGKPWWAPGPLSFYHLDNDVDLAATTKANMLKSDPDSQAREDDRPDDLAIRMSDEGSARTDQEPQRMAEERTTSEEATASEQLETQDASAQHRHHRGMGGRAPVVSYAVSKKRVLSQFKPGKIPLLAMRRGMGVDSSIKSAVWRPDMVNVLESMLRKQAVDALIRRATRGDGQNPHMFIEPCASWDKVKDVKLRGCVLWLPKNEVKGGGYPTLDVEAQYGAKLAVYNLLWLFGHEEVARLKEEALMFRDTELLVLKQWPTWSVKSLHMLLWRLQGFLAESQSKT